jgi:hypothetical protein
MSWSKDYKKSIDCNNPKGFSQRAHCAARKKRAKGEETKSKSPFNEMHQIKTHKTVEQIAKKHRLEVSFVKNQLEMGIPIEHEHTGDKDLATDIALQHLDEIPDYYTRLKKMESSAKKEHKKFSDVKEHCGCEDTAIEELEFGLKKLDDTSYNSIDKLMRRIMKKHDMTAKQLHNAFVNKNEKTPDDWIKDLKEEGLRDWFGKSKSKDGKPGWVNVVTGGTCASDEPGEGVPKCVSSEKRATMTPKQRLSAARRKKAADPGQQEKTGAAAPTYVSTDKPKKKMKEDKDLQEVKDKPVKGSGKKDACYTKVKSRYDVWPSAYASGALVKCRKVGAKNWGTKSEETMHEEERYCPLCDKREKRSECSYGESAWDKVSVKDHEYSMARSELSTIINAANRVQKKVGKGEGNLEAWVQSKITKAADYIDTVADYIDSGEMKEQTIADKILDEIIVEKCWTGYKRKKGKSEFSKGSCVKSENVSIEDANGNTFAEVIDLIQPEPIKGFKSQIKEATRLQAQTGNVIAVTLSWRGKYYSLKLFFPQLKTPSRKEINDEIQKVYPGCNVIYHSVSEIQPGQPLIQMCGPQGGSSAKLGPNKNYVKTMGEEVELEEGDTWHLKKYQNPKGGLTAAGVKKYREEHPGSKLKTAVRTKPSKLKKGSKSAKRRKSFCARMTGMKKKLTSAKTARDPNSRINKSLRAWNC